MLMTENEAGRRWCPMARHPEGNRARYGSDGDAIDPQYGIEAAAEFPCIGSRCAMWRRGEDRYDRPEKPLKAVPVTGKPGHFTTAPADLVAVPRGFCGLAGPVSS